MRQRLDLVSDLLAAHVGETAVPVVKQDVMGEFEVVLEQMPYVGGAPSRMTDFFMRLLGFMSIGRVLKGRGLSPTQSAKSSWRVSRGRCSQFQRLIEWKRAANSCRLRTAL